MEMLKYNLVLCIVIDIAYDVNIVDWWVDRFIVLLILVMCMWCVCCFVYMCIWFLYLFIYFLFDWILCLYFVIFEYYEGLKCF